MRLKKENKMNNENEVWRDIEGYEGMYQVSDKGRVRSLKFGKERILKPGRLKNDYLYVNLCKNGEAKKYYIHRLVAQAFLPNPDNLSQINHRDEIKTNNCVENLEWCDSKYNNNYGTHIQRQVEKVSKTVLQFTKSGEFVREWKSVADVKRNHRYTHAHISECCLGKYKSSHGFFWKYKN